MSHDHTHDHNHDHSHDDGNAGVKQHWPVVAIVAFVALVFLVSLVSFQVSSTEYVVVKRFGKPTGGPRDPGLNWKLPYPIDDLWRVDNRIHSFEGNSGVLEEVFTADEKNVIITTWVCWKVDKDSVDAFMVKLGTVAKAQEELTDLMRSHRSAVIGRYKFSDLVNVDGAKVKIAAIENEIREAVAADALALYGIDVTAVGIRHVGFPESVTAKVFDRMKAEREALAQDILSRGEAEGNKIRAEADKEREAILAEADKIAKGERADGDSEAATHYAVFAKNPELASFLRRLDSLKKVVGGETTLVFDTRTPPFDLLSPEALDNVSKSQKPAGDK